jgi:hypothetical protein
MAQYERTAPLSTEQPNSHLAGFRRRQREGSHALDSTGSVRGRAAGCWRDVSFSPPPARQVRDSTRRSLGLRYPAGTSCGPAAQARAVELDRHRRLALAAISGVKSATGGVRSSVLDWRKGWDSNPRYPCRHAGFQDRCLKPLGHPSIK